MHRTDRIHILSLTKSLNSARIREWNARAKANANSDANANANATV